MISFVCNHKTPWIPTCKVFSHFFAINLIATLIALRAESSTLIPADTEIIFGKSHWNFTEEKPQCSFQKLVESWLKSYWKNSTHLMKFSWKVFNKFLRKFSWNFFLKICWKLPFRHFKRSLGSIFFDIFLRNKQDASKDPRSLHKIAQINRAISWLTFQTIQTNFLCSLIIQLIFYFLILPYIVREHR